MKKTRTKKDPFKQIIADAHTPLEALKKILAHVEDMGAARVGSQCTLCFSYRMMGHTAVAKAEGKSFPDYLKSLG